MPTALQKLMTSHEVKKMKSTFCVWTEDGIAWRCNPMDGEDASRDLLSRIDGEAQTYVEYGKWFPADLLWKLAPACGRGAGDKGTGRRAEPQAQRVGGNQGRTG